MGALFSRMTTHVRRPAAAILLSAAIAWPMVPAPALARGPEGIADVAEQVIDAVVNISTKQTVDMSSSAMPQLPPGSPFEEFFEEFFKNRARQERRDADAAPHQLARLRLHHRHLRAGGDQQPRHRRRRRGQRHPQ